MNELNNERQITFFAGCSPTWVRNDTEKIKWHTTPSSLLITFIIGECVHFIEKYINAYDILHKENTLALLSCLYHTKWKHISRYCILTGGEIAERNCSDLCIRRVGAIVHSFEDKVYRTNRRREKEIRGNTEENN